MAETRRKVRTIVLGITGLIIAILFIRIVLDFINASTQAGFSKLLFDISDIVIGPIDGIAKLDTASEIDALNVTALIGIFIYFVTGLIIAEFINAFLQETTDEIILNVVDAIFKLLEFVLFLRLIFELLKVSQTSSFVQSINSITGWAFETLTSAKLLDGRIDISLLIALFIVVLLDIFSGSILKGFLSSSKKSTVGGSSGSPVFNNYNNTSPLIPQASSSYKAPAPRPKPVPQQINVNIPMLSTPAPMQPQNRISPPPVQQTYQMSPPPVAPRPQHQMNPRQHEYNVNVGVSSNPAPVQQAPIQPYVPQPLSPQPVQQHTHVASFMSQGKETKSSFFDRVKNALQKEKSDQQSGTATFGQQYQVKTLPERFRNPQAEKQSRLKKLFGSK